MPLTIFSQTLAISRTILTSYTESKPCL